MREFFGSFKSVCDNLSIDLTEFEQIFGANESSFVIWDTDENGLIDAQELFSGLTLLSAAEFEQKIVCKFSTYQSPVSPLRLERGWRAQAQGVRVHDNLLHAECIQDLQSYV